MLHYIKKSYISGQSAKLYLYSAHEKPVKYAKEVEAILKRISVKFQQQEQTYRSLHAAARSLLSSKGRVFLLFLLFYKVLTNFLFVPALQLIWALTLRFAPIQYLNNKTASRIFASPAIIGCIVVLAVLAAFWSLYEVAAMLQLLTRVRHGEPLRVGAVFRDAFCSLVRVFLPQNLPLLLYGAALIPLMNFFLAANHLTQFAVPEYLWGLLKARAANRLLFALAVLFVLALLLDGLVVLPKFLLERKSFGCAFAESLRILRSRTGQLLALALPLEEVLALCKGKTELNIEIKPSTFTPTLEAETVRLIHAYDYGADCVVTSQSYETLCKVKELDPDITTGYILALGVGTYYDLPAADFFSVESTFITAGMVQQIHLRGKTISAWTINRQQDAEKLLQLGVDDLITDKPEIIAPLLARDKALDNRLLWLRDQIQELLAAPDAEEAMEVEETIEDAIEDPEEVLDEA